MPDYRDFNKLNIIIRVEGILVNETPLRIGAGREPPLGAQSDIAVYMVNGTPCIPGSSLKGVFRSFVEAMLASEGNNVHNPWDEEAIKKEDKNKDFCIVCGIFGNTKLASHVRIYDVYPKNKELQRFQKLQRTGIAIDRVFGSVKAGSLFNEEFIAPNVEWIFKMDVINIDFCLEGEVKDERGRVLKNLLKTLTSIGLNVGSRKSVGCGLIKLKDVKLQKYRVVNGELKSEG